MRQRGLTQEEMLSGRAAGTNAAHTALQPGSTAISRSPLSAAGKATNGKIGSADEIVKPTTDTCKEHVHLKPLRE